MKLYAIGDIHGCYNAFLDIHNQILEDIGDSPAKVVFLGDYIDRGPDSALVVDHLRSLWLGQGHPNIRYEFLRGNHEDMLLNHMHNPNDSSFLYNGGIQTLQSYENENILISDHLDFFEDTQIYHRHGEFFFVHANLNPYITSWNDINYVDCIWDRTFNNYDKEFLDNVFVIHGHTPTPTPAFRANQLNIDTGCVFGRPYSETYGDLTAVRIDDRHSFTFFTAREYELE